MIRPMPSNAPLAKSTWSKAAKHLSRVDPVLGRVIERVGPCGLEPRRDYFVALCKAIFSQQLSTVVAATLFGRFRNEFPGRRPTPSLVLKLLQEDDGAVGRCGLSLSKAVYLCDLATHFVDDRIPTRKLARMSDDQVIEALVAVNGIGRWTAEMFLMFVLNRPDVLPVDDLGLREGVRDVFGLPERPTPAQVRAMGERWHPYRSVATWYIWRRGVTPGPPSQKPGPKRPAASAATKRPIERARRGS
jgi:DNA-3-methyladenine glycosylase II